MSDYESTSKSGVAPAITTTYVYNLTVPYNDNENTDKKQVVAVANDAARVTPTYTQTTMTSLDTTNPDTVGTAFDADGKITITCTAEDTSVTKYEINVTIGDTVKVVDGGNRAGATVATGEFQVTDTSDTAAYATAEKVRTDEDIKFKIETFAGEYASKVTLEVDGREIATLEADARGVYTITTEILSSVAAGKTITIEADIAANVVVSAATGKDVWVNGTKVTDTNTLSLEEGEEIIFAIPADKASGVAVTGGAATTIKPVPAETDWPLNGYNYYTIIGAEAGETLVITHGA